MISGQDAAAKLHAFGFYGGTYQTWMYCAVDSYVMDQKYMLSFDDDHNSCTTILVRGAERNHLYLYQIIDLNTGLPYYNIGHKR